MPGWYLDLMIRLQRPYERRRYRRMMARRNRAAARSGAGALTTQPRGLAR